ncbi:MAG: hypothetical protein ACEY3L_13830 [Wolbachia sp.]
MSSTGMTPFAVQFTFKNECSCSYAPGTPYIIGNYIIRCKNCIIHLT